MNNNIFNPFQSIEAIKAQGYDSGDLRNFAFRGLESANVSDFIDFIEQHKNNASLQDFIEMNCNISVDEALDYLQLETSANVELTNNIFASCNQFYSQQCEELAEIFDFERIK